MADSNAAKKIKPEQAEPVAQDSSQAAPTDKRSLILMILVVFNSLAFAGIGFGLYKYSQATRDVVKSATEIEEVKEHDKGKEKQSENEVKIVALESFLLNLDGNEGYKLLKVNMSLEVDNSAVQEEIQKRQAQVRDMIIILLTSKRYGQVSGENAQEKLKDEIMDTVNSILTKGKIKKILFTEFVFQ